MAKKDSTRARRSSRQQLPARPTLFFNDLPQSDGFVAGALAARDVIAALCTEDLPGEGSFADEREHAEQLTERLVKILDCPGDARLGAAAALAHFIVVAREAMPADNMSEWIPLERVPEPELTRDDVCLVADGSLFFDLAGEPVSVGPELNAYAWCGPCDHRRVSVDLVRMLGKPTSAREFERRRLVGCAAE